ncbi:MAG: NADH-quinone oxidoreductase subunit A [Planctomycetes bacterium]|nr:NADH-quinone oxidoreductase subunit A [Planctomycetota bacterium]
MLGTHPYTPILILLAVVVGIVVAIMVLSHMIGTSRHGHRKDAPYEAGMPVLIDARRRFHARFYVVALLFLLFDVEVVLMWPWAVVFHQAAVGGGAIDPASDSVAGAGFLLAAMMVSVALLLVGLIYEWGRGALRWR